MEATANDSIESEFSAQIYEEFISSSKKAIYCEVCGNASSKKFCILNLAIVCEFCQMGTDQQTPFNSLPVVEIMNSPDCILNMVCGKKARWYCHSGPAYCDDCHIKNCLIFEKKSNFVCKPKPLFFPNSNSLCHECDKIPAEFKIDDDKLLCIRCATTKPKPATTNRILKSTDEVKKRVSEVNDSLNSQINHNRMQIAKFGSILGELSLLTQVKYSFINKDALDSAFDEARKQHMENKSKQTKIQLISALFVKELFIQNLIENSLIDIPIFEKFLDEILNLLTQFRITYVMPRFSLDQQQCELVCSQNSESAYDTEYEEALEENETDVHMNRDPSETDRHESVFPPGELSPCINQEQVETKLLYFRDPFWMFFIIPGFSGVRDEILNSLKQINSSDLRKLPNDSIYIGMEVVIRDKTRKIPDGHPFKRGLVERLPSQPGGTYCINIIDFGYKLKLNSQYLFTLPPAMARKPFTIMRGQLMGIMPFSKFTFTTTLAKNAPLLLKIYNDHCNGKVKIKRCYQIGNSTFLKVHSKLNGKLIDWSEELIKAGVAIPYERANKCFRPKKNYCYTYHSLKQCNPSECNRVHECPYCEQSHRLLDCKKYLEEEKNSLI